MQTELPEQIHAGVAGVITRLMPFWHAISTSAYGQIFLISAFLLVVGLVMKVRSRAFWLSFLNTELLSDIEKVHPHLPSFKSVIIIFLCNIQLLVVSLYAMQGTTLFAGAYYWLYLTLIFVLSATASILAELQWERASEHALAFSVGTTLAFLIRLILISITGGPALQIILICVLTGLSLFLAWMLMARVLRNSARRTLILVFTGWLLLILVG